MTKSNRREFLKSGAALTAAALVGTKVGGIGAAEKKNTPDVVVVKGTDRFRNTERALAVFGQGKPLIPPGATVGLLANSPPWWKNPGSYTHPDVVLATVLMCRELGAKKIRFLLDPPDGFWAKTTRSKKHKKAIAAIEKCTGNYVDKPVKQGKSLKTVKIIKDLFDCDAYINLPIIKHHTGCLMSCNLKNLMGANTHEANQFFHHGSGAKESYGDVAFLSQCIADLNTLRKPALCVVDASEVLSTNGPGGPGKLAKLNRVVVGRDSVGIDAYCAKLLGLNPKAIGMIQQAAAHGLGTADPGRLTIKEIAG